MRRVLGPVVGISILLVVSTSFFPAIGFAQTEAENEHRIPLSVPVSTVRTIGRAEQTRVAVRSFSVSELAQTWSRLANPVADQRVTQVAAGAAASSLVLQSFPGPSDSRYFPSDPIIAAGPNHLIATINARVAIYDKSGHALSNVSLDQFMLGHADPSVSFWDTRTIYNQSIGRFVIISAWGDRVTKGGAYLAVSASSDATGLWNVSLLENNGKYWVDYPQIGVTTNSLFISLFENPFPTTTGPSQCPLVVVGLPELLSGSPQLNITRFANVNNSDICGDAATPVQNPTPSNTGYLLALASSSSLNLMTLDTSGTAALTVSTVSIPAYDVPQGGAQPGTTTRITPGASSILSAVFRNGSIWCNQTVKPTSGTGNAAVRWMQLDPAGGTTVQSGEVHGVGDAYIGATNILPNGDVDLVYTTSSNTQFASGGYAHRSASDPPGTMPVSGVYAAGSNDYFTPRWGDFAGLAADPDGNSAWGIVEVATGGGSGTAIVQLALSASSPGGSQLSLALTPAAATVQSGSSATFNMAVTEQGASAPVSFSCSGLPAGATCAFSPSTLNGSGNATLSISTPARAAASRSPFWWRGVLATAGFGLLGLVVGPRRRRLYLLMALVLTGILAACGGVASRSTPSSTSTTPTTFAVSVTASNGSTSASGLVSLTVD